MIPKKAKYAVGEFVDLNHEGNSMQVNGCVYDDKTNEFRYSLLRVRDSQSFDSSERHLRDVNNDKVIMDLVSNVNELSDLLVQQQKRKKRI